MSDFYFIVGSNGFILNIMAMDDLKVGFILNMANMADNSGELKEELETWSKDFSKLASYQKDAVAGCALSIADSVVDFEERKNCMKIILGLLKIEL